MKKSLQPYKENIFKKFINFVKNIFIRKNEYVNISSKEQKIEQSDFKESIKVVDEFADAKKIISNIQNHTARLEEKNEEELDEIEMKLSKYFQNLQTEVNQLKKRIKEGE